MEKVTKNKLTGRKQFNHLRHKWEMPLIWISTVVTFISIVLGIWILVFDSIGSKILFRKIDLQGIIYFIILGISLFMILLFLLRFYQAAQAKSSAIRVGPNQFKSIWSVYSTLGEKLEMKRLPKLYIINGNGTVNAYALSCNTRHKYIVLYSEIALLIDDSPEIVEFVLAHEMAHHKLNHTSLWRLIIGIIPNTLRPLGLSTTRAQEYSADRVAATICSDFQGALKLMAVGPWLHNKVNPNTWSEQCKEENKEIFIRIANLMSSHAVNTKRYMALKELSEKGIRSHGSMF